MVEWTSHVYSKCGPNVFQMYSPPPTPTTLAPFPLLIRQSNQGSPVPRGKKTSNLFIRCSGVGRSRGSSAPPSESPINRSRSFRVKGSTKDQPMKLCTEQYDVGILGCGVGGHAAAINAMERGLKVIIFTGDQDSIGGTCVNVGCIPSKSLLYATGKYRELKNLAKLYTYGIHTDAFSKNEKKDPVERNQLLADSVHIDIGKLKEYTQNVINKLKGGIEYGLKNQKFCKNSEHVQVIYERGHIVEKNIIKGGKSGKEYKVKNIIIATGSTPNVPDNIEVDERTVFTSDQAVKLEGLQKYMGIIGMGIIGIEFTDIYTALGSEVVSFDYSPQLLPLLDADVAGYFDRVFIKSKPMRVHLNTRIEYVRADRGGQQVIIGHSERNSAEEPTSDHTNNEIRETRVDSCLVAIGRKPNTNNLGLEQLQIQTNRGYVSVDEHLRVQKEDQGVYDHIFCIGDANGRQMLAHTASHQALKVVDWITAKGEGEHISVHSNRSHSEWASKPIIYRNIPSVCYTTPELAFVGLTEKEAKKLHPPENVGTEISFYKANSKVLCEHNDVSFAKDWKNNPYNKGRYNCVDNTSGMVKIVYLKDSKEILGLFIVGSYASILIHEGVLALNLKLSAIDLAHMVHSHPTISEVLDTAFKAIARVRTH
ncbi:dihydrolipoamide dehydrogenase [Plasmodium inui San Antonio 1]|uniref:Dihydrolipoamide dehydrogenase n=1 Tax=Plasmodium inui San Antonio 1 TaxID=1237626 RepID=W7AD10_9APIC|nr:dihydrolipoamide dehydrogenase [Plasmodium inui San Antonio 1]EUD66979.1 dihydrolipoamide dehydrogenase [Plasmodium inui San Antonio 1]